MATLVHQGKLFDLLGGKNCQRFVGRDTFMARDEVALRHHVFHQGGVSFVARDKAHIPVRNDSDQKPVTFNDRDPRHSECGAQFVDIGDGGIRRDGDGVRDHARLTAFHFVDCRGLIFDRKVSVQDANSTLTRHGDGHPFLGHRVHGRGQQRSPQSNVLRELRGSICFARNHISVSGKQHHVVVGQPYETEGIFICHCSDPDFLPDFRPESSHCGSLTS